MPTFALIDFETTGLSPEVGDRPTELAILLVRSGVVVDRMCSLMNPGRRIPWDVQHLTGITDAMVAKAPPVREVMRQAMQFVGDHPLVAHNAAFDRRFWEAEMNRLPAAPPARFACTLLLARRLYPEAPNHRLGTLVRLHRLPAAAQAHRAMADVEMTYAVWRQMDRDLRVQFSTPALDFDLMSRLQKAPRTRISTVIEKYKASTGRSQNET